MEPETVDIGLPFLKSKVLVKLIGFDPGRPGGQVYIMATQCLGQFNGVQDQGFANTLAPVWLVHHHVFDPKPGQAGYFVPYQGKAAGNPIALRGDHQAGGRVVEDIPEMGQGMSRTIRAELGHQFVEPVRAGLVDSRENFNFYHGVIKMARIFYFH